MRPSASLSEVERPSQGWRDATEGTPCGGGAGGGGGGEVGVDEEEEEAPVDEMVREGEAGAPMQVWAGGVRLAVR